MTLKNTFISGCRQRKFEPYDPDHRESCFYKLGFADVEKADRKILDIDNFFEEGLKFPNHNLLDLISPNVAEYTNKLSTLQIQNQNVALNPYTNTKVFEDINLDYRKVREFQNKIWATESLNQGIELTQHKYYSEAIEFFNNAISMDDSLVDAYVAKGCALANNKDFGESLKLLEKALEKDPEHENAKKYHEAISAKLKELEKETFKIDDRNKVKLVKTKTAPKENFSELILVESDNESDRKSKKSKKKRR